MHNFFNITINEKQIKVAIKINKPKDINGYHYDVEILTKERISGDEFQLLRQYIEDEGWVD
jgi:hypothetical protein